MVNGISIWRIYSSYQFNVIIEVIHFIRRIRFASQFVFFHFLSLSIHKTAWDHMIQSKKWKKIFFFLDTLSECVSHLFALLVSSSSNRRRRRHRHLCGWHIEKIKKNSIQCEEINLSFHFSFDFWFLISTYTLVVKAKWYKMCWTIVTHWLRGDCFANSIRSFREIHISLKQQHPNTPREFSLFFFSFFDWLPRENFLELLRWHQKTRVHERHKLKLGILQFSKFF